MKLNRTALRTVDILKLVSKKPDGITLDQICEQLSIPKTSAYDILTTLVHTGMVHVAREQKQRYTIGLTAYRVGINYTNNMDFIGTIDPVLKAFSKEVGKTVFFGVRADDEIVYICKYEPENPIITTATVGTKNPIYCTSLGKAILAYSEEEERLALTERIHFRAFTERTIRDKACFLDELEKVRKRAMPWTPENWRSIWNVSALRFLARMERLWERSAFPAFISQQRIMKRWDEESVKRPPCFQGFWDI